MLTQVCAAPLALSKYPPVMPKTLACDACGAISTDEGAFILVVADQERAPIRTIRSVVVACRSECVHVLAQREIDVAMLPFRAIADVSECIEAIVAAQNWAPGTISRVFRILSAVDALRKVA